MIVCYKRILLFTWLMSFGHIGYAQSLSLLAAYEAALQHDPIYRSAMHENQAGEQAEAIGRSHLLPSLVVTHAQNKNSGSMDTGVGTQPLNFDGQVSTLTLRQPLFNMEAIAGYQQGKARADSSRAKFIGHGQQLVVRLVEAYVETLLAQEHVNISETQRDALEELKRVNERMLQKGEGTTTDVLETQSKFALSEAKIIEARDEFEIAKLKLETIVGQKIMQLDRLSNSFSTGNIHLPDYDSWHTLALEQNAELITQRHNVVSGKEEIKKNRAGHMPRVDFVASLQKNKRGSFITQGLDAEFGTVGIEVNMPLYSGGRVNALTAQATANHARAEADLDAATDKVMVDLRKQYNQLVSGIKRIESLELVVKSAELLVDATQKSIRGGIRINLNLLDAQQQLHTARLDLAQARYRYLLAYLRLQLAAGTLALNDLQNIARYFITNQN